MKAYRSIQHRSVLNIIHSVAVISILLFITACQPQTLPPTESPAASPLTATSRPSSTPTPLPTPTVTPEPMLTREMVTDLIQKAMTALPEKDRLFINLAVSEEKINSFLEYLETEGIIGSAEILRTENNLQVEFSGSGHLVLKFGVFTNTDSETYHDFCITEAIRGGINGDFLTVSLEGVREAAVGFGIDPSKIIKVKTDEDYRFKAVSSSDQALLYINGYNEDDPESSGQWLPADADILVADTQVELEEEGYWVLAEALAENTGIDVIPYIFDMVSLSLKYEKNGQIIEIHLPINPEDIYKNQNLETILAECWLDEMIISRYASDPKLFEYQYLPALFEGSVKKISDLPVNVKLEGGEGGRVIKVYLFIPSRNGSFGILLPAWVEMLHFHLAYNPIEEEYKWTYLSNFGDANRRPVIVQEEFEEFTQLKEGDFLLITDIFGEDYHWQNVDGNPPFTDTEREGLFDTVVAYPKPGNAYNLTTREDIDNLLEYTSSINKEIFIPGGPWLAPGKMYVEEN